MSAVPDLRSIFLDLEKRLEAESETVTGEIVRGVYSMTPRPRARHGGAQGRLFAALHSRLGSANDALPPEWLFVIEPELRSLRNFSRVVPDVAGWSRSGAGWPDLDVTPVSHMPDWVAEVLLPSTAAFDREGVTDPRPVTRMPGASPAVAPGRREAAGARKRSGARRRDRGSTGRVRRRRAARRGATR